MDLLLSLRCNGYSISPVVMRCWLSGRAQRLDTFSMQQRVWLRIVHVRNLNKYLRLVAKHAPFWVRLWQMRSQEIVAHRPNHRKERSKRVGEQGTRTRSTRTPTLKHMNWLIIVLRTLHNSPCTSGVRTPFEHFPIYLKPHSRVLGSWQLDASNEEAWLWIK